jgi:cell wall-associated NlpC family hydrolase
MDQKINFNGNAIASSQILQQNQIETLLKKLVNTPYLTGGQSIFGMDAFGLIRFYLKYLGIKSPKSMDEILKIGEDVGLIKNAKFGDLVFWGQKNVEQVSILLNNNSLIHCNGMIKISKYDYLGIINSEDNSYEFSKIIKIIRL